MKLKTLLVSAVALLCSAGMWATDVDFISRVGTTNSSWGSASNTTPTCGSSSIVMNERYYDANAGRPTGLIMTQNVNLPNGTYDVVVYAHACHANGVGGDFVASNNTLSVNGSSRSITTIDESTASNLPMDEYTFTSVNVIDGVMTISFYATGQGANWFTIKVKSLTLKNVEDKTSMITNADFSAESQKEKAATGWNGTKAGSGDKKKANFTTQTSSQSFTSGTFVEMWASGSNSLSAQDLNQTISNLPAGVYSLSANVNADIPAYLYASISGTLQTHMCKGLKISQSLTFVVNSTSDVAIGLKHSGGSAGSRGTWVAVDDFKLYRLGDVGVADLTSQIASPSFEDKTTPFQGWTNTGEMAQQDNTSFEKTGGYYAEYWQPNGTKGVKQTLSGLPAGYYTLSADCKARGVTSAKIFVDSNETPITIGDVTNNYSVGFNCDGSTNFDIGLEAECTGAGSSWLAVDNFTLSYKPYISVIADNYPSGGNLEAETWYVYTVSNSGDYYFSATEGVVYTTNGEQVYDAATTSDATSTILFTEGDRVYVKSTSSQTVTIKPSITTIASSYPSTGSFSAETWYVYTIPMTGDYYFSATSGVVYTTNGEQVYDAATTSAAATKVSFTKDAKVYVKSTTAQTVKLEGKFYLSTIVNGVRKWLSKDASGYTYAYNTGLQFVLKSDDNIIYQLIFSEGNYLNDVGSNWQTKAEGSNNNGWKLSPVEGGYKLLLEINNACELFVKDTSTGLVEITHSTADGNTWQFVTPDNYDNYPALNTINEKIEAVGELPYADSSKKPSTYNGTSDVASHVTSLTTALRAYVESNALAEGVVGATNCTNRITNPSCPATEHPNTDKYYYNPDGWTSNLIVVNKTGDVSGYTSSSDEYTEFYYSSHGSFWANDQYSSIASMSQTVTGLSAGRYLLTVCSRITSGATMTMSANGVDIACPQSAGTPGTFGNGWEDTSLLFTVGNEGTAEISMTMNNNNAFHHWFNFNNFRLVRIGDLDGLTIAETTTSAPSITTDYKDVTLTRTLNNGYWNTFCSPIDIDAATISSTFGAGTLITEFDTDTEVSANTLTFKEANSIKAGKPYLIKPANTTVNPTFSGVKVTATSGQTITNGSFKFIGVIAQTELAPNGDGGSVNYFVNTSNEVVKLSEAGNLKGMRAYFNVPLGAAVKLSIGGVETGIESIDGIENNEQTIYNLAGQRLNKAQKGVNIINGKKVLIK